MMLADAFSGLRFLKQDLAVDPAAISIIGFSYGRMVSVLVAYEQIRSLFARSCAERFAGHVTYYGCSVPRLEDPTAAGGSVLMLMAERDRNVSLTRTEQIVLDLRRGGADVELKIYENAYHQWDGSEREKRFSLFRYAIATSGSTPHRAFGMSGAVEKSRAAGVSFGSLLAT